MGTKRKNLKEVNNNLKKFHSDSSLSQISGDSTTSGVVEKITVKNFMCHNLLEIKFNKNINFLVGRNGSGKSAILTALIVGLGGKASATNRFNSVKGFIKNGQRSCQIEITLNNQGELGYKQNIFGEKIIVVRTISINGSSTYRLKSTTGEIVSRTLREILKICDLFNIQVDNPICVLNQDTSRNFLNTSDPKKKYILFMRATNLEFIDEYYQKLSKNVASFKLKIKDKQQDYETLKNERMIWENKYKLHESIEKLRESVEQLDAELFWLKFKEMKNKYENLLKIFKEHKNKYEQKLSVIKNKSEYVEKSKQKIKSIENEINQIKKEKNAFELNLKNLKGKCNNFENELNDINCKINNLNKSVQMKKDNANSYQKLINIDDPNSEVILQKQQQLKDEMDQFNEELKSIKAKLETAELELQQRQSSIYNSMNEEKRLNEIWQEKNSAIFQKNAQIKSLSAKGGTNLLLYGPNVAKVHSTIQLRKNKFTEVPRGPLGYYIKVKDRKWCSAIETFLGHKLLNSFLVTNDLDSKQLVKIFNEVFGQSRHPSIICSKFFHKVHDTRQKELKPPRGYQSLQKALKISDAVVENVLIDKRKIERILMLPNDEAAHRLLSSEENVPQNCMRGLTINGDTYYPYPNYKSYGTKLKAATLLQSSSEEIIKQFEQDIENLKFEKQRIENERTQIGIDRKKQEKSKLDQVSYCEQLRKQKIKIDEEILKLNLKIQDLSQKHNVESLVKDLDDIEKEIEKNETKLRILNESKVKNERLFDEAKEQYNKIKIDYQIIDDRLQVLVNDVAKEKWELDELLQKDKYNENLLNNLKKSFVESQERVNQMKQQLDEYEEQSQNFGEEITDPRSEEEINDEKKRISSDIVKVESEKEDKRYVYKMYKSYKDKCDDIEMFLDKCHGFYRNLKDTLNERLRKYPILVQKIENLVSTRFQNALMLRNYQGVIEINHESKKLELLVQTDSNPQSNGNTKSLSGGERSYTTVAFIMALWSCVKSPFYFMDEFDVFMDKVNRRTIMDLLIQHANANVDRQFTFLTPQDLSNINASDNLTIYRMPDPERTTQ